MLVGVWDVPDSPVAWTAQGCDQSTLVRCPVNFCEVIVRYESISSHLQLTHGVIPEEEPDGT